MIIIFFYRVHLEDFQQERKHGRDLALLQQVNGGSSNNSSATNSSLLRHHQVKPESKLSTFKALAFCRDALSQVCGADAIKSVVVATDVVAYALNVLGDPKELVNQIGAATDITDKLNFVVDALS